MYAHILIATDGSELSQRAIADAIALANYLHAKITVIAVSSPLYGNVMGEATKHLPEMEQIRFKWANDHLDYVSQMAKSANVACETVHVTGKFPYEGIVQTAIEKGCDLIVMASHGRSGIRAFLLGSETQKVLTHSKIPVLVHR